MPGRAALQKKMYDEIGALGASGSFLRRGAASGRTADGSRTVATGRTRCASSAIRAAWPTVTDRKDGAINSGRDVSFSASTTACAELSSASR